MGNSWDHELILPLKAENIAGPVGIAIAKRVLETTTEGVLVTDRNVIIQWVNRAFTSITGYSPEEVIGRRPFFLRVAREGQENFCRRLRRYLVNHELWEGKLWLRHKNGELIPRWVTVTAIRDQEGKPIHYLALCTSLAHKETNPQTVAQVAHHDALTGLGNRLQFYSMFEATINLAIRRGLRLALFYIDLDRLDDINALLGFLVGDRVLQVLGRRISELAQEHGTALRIGGDEFVLLVPLEREELAVFWGERILQRLRQPVRVKGQNFIITGSVGVAFYPKDGATPDELLHAAHLASKRAKMEGKNRLAFFSLEDHSALRARMALEQDLCKAITSGELVVYYQPYFSLREGEMRGLEALIRWNHPTRGLLLPGDFIPIAEETDLIVPLGEYVLRSACTEVQKLREKGLGPVRLAVNVSGRQLNEKGFVATLKKILISTDFDPRLLDLEITETTAIYNTETVERIFNELEAMGVRLVIDDFGSGYGTLRYLRSPVHTIKIDHSFIKGVPSNRYDTSIVLGIMALAKSLERYTVAEGVETLEQLQWLKEQGCDLVQGFLFCPPMAAEELLAWVKVSRGRGGGR